MTEHTEIQLPSFRRGFHLITHLIEKKLPALPENGILHLFIRHTSAGLTINENADPSVREDFETVFNKLIPEGDQSYRHIFEGVDDLPAHIKASLSGASVSVPIKSHRLHMGTWQGIYLCEFRNAGGNRKITASIIS